VNGGWVAFGAADADDVLRVVELAVAAADEPALGELPRAIAFILLSPAVVRSPWRLSGRNGTSGWRGTEGSSRPGAGPWIGAGTTIGGRPSCDREMPNRLVPAEAAIGARGGVCFPAALVRRVSVAGKLTAMAPDELAFPAGADGSRASDRDRELALEQLSTAASDGRLTLEEYSARADRALAARMLGELAELTTDLERPPDPVAAAPEQMAAILSSDSRDGHWRVPAQLSARTVLGECKIDMQDAVLSSRTTVIEARATLGTVEIFAPDGVEVRLTGKGILGEKTSTVRQAIVPGAPVIEVRATAILGTVKVSPARISKRLGGSLGGTSVRAPTLRS